jgi:Na+-transporting NADH:ubiquinone oxidoreductase subunit A
MKYRGGYNIPLAGRPAGEVQVMPDPSVLRLGLRSRRFHFSKLAVADGDAVRQGQVLAADPDHYDVPLLSPRAGSVRLDDEQEVLVLENVAQEEEQPYEPAEHAAKRTGPAAARRRKLLDLGAWQFFHEAHTGKLPDPFGTPRAVIVSTVRLEPFSLRGDVQLDKRLSAFTRGLEHLQGLLEYQPIYLVVPEVRSELADEVRRIVRGYARVETVLIPRKYPFDHFALLARRLGLPGGNGESVWALHTEGVLAVDRALELSRPCTVRLVAVGGPGIEKPLHVKAFAGYPIEPILAACGGAEGVRVLDGGALTGEAVGDGQAHLGSECHALTVLRDDVPRQFLGFARPGWKTQSFSKLYVSSARQAFAEPLTTELRGERRACVACGYCQDVCPAGLWPHLIHKYLYQESLEDAERARIDLCVRCGLCSYVCTSKIELMEQFVTAQRQIEQEHLEAEWEAQRQAEREARRQAEAEAQTRDEPPGPADDAEEGQA